MRASLSYALLFALTSGLEAREVVAVQLASQGQASLPIIVSPEATPGVRRAAETLANYLERISGAEFQVETGDGMTGIAVGQPSDFPALPYQKQWDLSDPTQTEAYLLESHAKGLHVIGASELAVEHAVWGLLDHLGYRQFFPGEAWEIVPQARDLKEEVSQRQQPDYHSRRIWYGYGPWDYAVEPYRQWCARNRATSGIALNTGHAYDGILQRNRAEFEKHPEYLGLVNGERRSTKFCISNPDLRRLVLADALRQIEKDPQRQSVSVDPSDGGGWCECDACSKLGSVSNRAVTLANDVAAALDARYGNKFVGMYAYNEHSPPPSVRVHPRVVISVATAFIRGGYTVDQLLSGWNAQGATLGIREYYSVHTWSRDLPGAARGANLTYLRTMIPHFYKQGARFLSAESSDDWGPNGLGYYLAARMLWDVDAADRLEELRADFLDKAFEDAREPMDRFYRLIDGANRPLFSDDLMGRMYRLLQTAQSTTNDPAVQRRLQHLVLYTRYLELWSDYATAQGPQRQAAFEALIRHGYRMRTTMMIHAKALYRDVNARDRSVEIPPEALWQVPEGKNPWKSSQPFSQQELDGFVKLGIERRRTLDFEPIAYSNNLMPATPLKLPDVPMSNTSLMSRGTRSYFTWLAAAPAELQLQATAGNIYQNRGDAKLQLFPAAETLGQAVAQAGVPPDRQEHSVQLKSTFTGLHRLEISDSSAGTRLNWPEGVPMTVLCSPESPASFVGRWNLYFYVPRGTRVIGGFASGEGALKGPDDKVLHTFGRQPGYFSVRVPEGMDGRLWKFHHSSGQRLLLTVPPCLARNSRELLLPAEVVEKDSAAQ